MKYYKDMTERGLNLYKVSQFSNWHGQRCVEIHMHILNTWVFHWRMHEEEWSKNKENYVEISREEAFIEIL